jgi:signal peptidase II
VRRLAPYLGILAGVVALDQLTKAILVRTLPLHEYWPIVDGLLSLSHVHNRGAAFGVLSDARLPYQPVLLSILSLAALCAIGYYFVRLPNRARLPRLALALVLGGAVGNLIDRVRLGYVRDFIHVYWREYSWPDFNVADSAITVGVILLILDIILESRNESSETPSVGATPSTSGRID